MRLNPGPLIAGPVFSFGDALVGRGVMIEQLEHAGMLLLIRGFGATVAEQEESSEAMSREIIRKVNDYDELVRRVDALFMAEGTEALARAHTQDARETLKAFLTPPSKRPDG